MFFCFFSIIFIIFLIEIPVSKQCPKNGTSGLYGLNGSAFETILSSTYYHVLHGCLKLVFIKIMQQP